MAVSARAAGCTPRGGSVTIAGTNNTANNTAISSNQADGGNGGFGGRGGVGVGKAQTGGVGGAGGVGGEGAGGGMYLNAAPLTVGGGVTFATNGVNGGAGGRSGPGGQGWSAKIGTRGTLKSSFGGNGGNGGAGGAGGAAQGGGLFAAGSGLSISLGDAAGGVVMSNNNVFGGHGGNGQAGAIGAGASHQYIATTYLDGRGGNGGNGAFAIGGGAAIYGDKLVLTNAAFQNNGVQGGGGGTNRGRYPFYDSSYDHTSALSTGVSGGGGSALGGAGGSGQGGGLYVSGSSSVTILNSTLANNSANFDDQATYNYFGNNGGAGGNDGKNFVTYYDSKMHGSNGGTGGTNQGAGLYAISTTLSVLNSTIADNAIYDSLGGAAGTGAQGNGIAGANGSSQGGGVFATGGSLSLTNDTIAWNFLYPAAGTGDLGAGIYNDASNTLTLQNTIVAKNQIYSTTIASTPSDLYGAASSSSDHNLIGDGSGSSGLANGTNGNQVGTDASPIDPLFTTTAPAGPGPGQEQAPSNYGGLTPTLPLSGNSPAIATGNPSAASTIAAAEGVASGTATDQRGLPRLKNGLIDIGSTELQVDFTGSPSVTTVQAGQSGQTITYTVNVTNGEGEPLNVTLTDVVPGGTTYVSKSAGGSVYSGGSQTGWTTINELSATNYNTLTAKATLNPGDTATLTFEVLVATNASGIITDTANLGWTGTNTNTSGSLSVPMSTTVTGGVSTTSTVLTSSGNPSVYGQPVTFTATISGPGTPTGEVVFEDGNTTLGTGTISGGVATFTTSSLSVGNNSITAAYGGDTNDLGSTSKVFTQQVDYHFGGFLPPLSNGLGYEINRTIPIKFALSDYNGNAITSLSAVTSIQLQPLDANGNPTGAPFTPVSTNNQGLEYTGGHYQYNWQTKVLRAGSYEIIVNFADGAIQTKTVQLIANGSAAGLTAGTSGGTATAGALLGGEVDLYVDNSNGDLTSDELARIQDAINAMDTTIALYGVAIVSVSDPTLANATLNMSTTSSLGGVAQGALGVTTDADQITIIQGWNWYEGADPAQIASGQYDFETAVMHELGHVLGLGHSSSSNSVMYATLTTGTTSRTLTAADLNVPDGDTGPCALHTAPAAVVNSASSTAGSTAPSSMRVPNSGGSLSVADQLFTDFTLLLSDLRDAYQAQLSSVSQRLVALLSLEAGAIGLFQDAVMRELL